MQRTGRPRLTSRRWPRRHLQCRRLHGRGRSFKVRSMKEFGTPLKLDRVSLGQCLQRFANDPNTPASWPRTLARKPRAPWHRDCASLCRLNPCLKNKNQEIRIKRVSGCACGGGGGTKVQRYRTFHTMAFLFRAMHACSNIQTATARPPWSHPASSPSRCGALESSESSSLPHNETHPFRSGTRIADRAPHGQRSSDLRACAAGRLA